MRVAKFLLRWVFWNVVAASIGALFGTLVLIAVLNVTQDPEIRNSSAFTAAYLSLYALPSATFAATVSVAQRRLIMPFHYMGRSWIGTSALGAGLGALFGLWLIAMKGSAPTKVLSLAFGPSLSLGIGLGLGFGQWLHLRG